MKCTREQCAHTHCLLGLGTGKSATEKIDSRVESPDTDMLVQAKKARIVSVLMTFVC